MEWKSDNILVKNKESVQKRFAQFQKVKKFWCSVSNLIRYFSLFQQQSGRVPSDRHGAPMDQTLHIDTSSDPVPYRALYNYKPQNDDELELREGDTVFVMEKCDDGWYVGSSQRSGGFGTFPGNYVERASWLKKCEAVGAVQCTWYMRVWETKDFFLCVRSFDFKSLPFNWVVCLLRHNRRSG